MPLENSSVNLQALKLRKSNKANGEYYLDLIREKFHKLSCRAGQWGFIFMGNGTNEFVLAAPIFWHLWLAAGKVLEKND